MRAFNPVMLRQAIPQPRHQTVTATPTVAKPSQRHDYVVWCHSSMRCPADPPWLPDGVENSSRLHAHRHADVVTGAAAAGPRGRQQLYTTS
jgi:hypothetical protein